MPRTGAIFQGTCLALLLGFGQHRSLLAQTPAPDVTDRSQPGAIPDLTSSFIKFRQSEEVGTLESVERAPAPDMFVLYTTQTYYHLDNVFLTDPAQDANVWVGAVGLSVVPYSTYRWTPRFTVEAALVRFDSVSFADYNMQSIGFENRLGLTRDNMLSWNFGVSAARSETRRSLPGEFYKRIQFVNNLNWFCQLDRAGHWAFHASPGVTWIIANPVSENRVDAGAIVSVLWLPNRKLVLEPFVEAGFAYYPDYTGFIDPASTFSQDSRHDLHLRSGMNFLWQFSDHASLVASAYWLGNRSSDSRANYEILPYITLNARIGF